jgi:carbon starvation protein
MNAAKAGMNITTTIIILVLIPIVVAGGFALLGLPMNAAVVAILGAVMIYLAYNWYARRIDSEIINADEKKPTPAKMYMDGVDFMPTSRNVLYGYHFKSIAAAGPIVGVITAANLWGWLPSILWLILGVTFIGWVSDYSAIMVAVRNEGNSLSAIAHRLIAPRTRLIMFVFIFFYLLLIAGAFVGILAGILDPRADVPFGILMLAIMGLLMGQMLYKWKMDLIIVTIICVGVTLISMMLGAWNANPKQGTDASGKPATALVFEGPINGAVAALGNGINTITGGHPLYTVVDPTRADPRLGATMLTADGKVVPKYIVNGQIAMTPSFIFWVLFLFVFSYLGANLPIWRFAQPVNYIGFWITVLVIGLSAIGALLGGLLGIFNPDLMKAVTFQTSAFTQFFVTQQAQGQAVPALQWLWPMLFVTIACGAISGWHALFGSIGTARQLEYETDALPVGGGAMFSENTLALLSLVAVSIAGGAGAAAFASGVGKLLNIVSFSLIPLAYGTALGFGAFVVIVLTVVQLVFRLMRVTLSEWLGERWVGFKNANVATIVSMVLTLLLVMSGTWIYLWQLFGASNQLMAALSLLIVTLWLRETKRNPTYALIPMLFMYITTMAATLFTAWNLYASILSNPAVASQPINLIGAVAMIAVAILLFVAAGLIGWDGWKAWNKYKGAPVTAPASGPAAE